MKGHGIMVIKVAWVTINFHFGIQYTDLCKFTVNHGTITPKYTVNAFYSWHLPRNYRGIYDII